MPPRKVEYHPAATAEGREAFLWYEQRNRRAAARFEAELRRSLLEVEQHPERPRRHRFGTRRLLLRGFPYMIIYRVAEGTLQILAVAHAHRKTGYWKERLAD